MSHKSFKFSVEFSFVMDLIFFCEKYLLPRHCYIPADYLTTKNWPFKALYATQDQNKHHLNVFEIRTFYIANISIRAILYFKTNLGYFKIKKIKTSFFANKVVISIFLQYVVLHNNSAKVSKTDKQVVSTQTKNIYFFVFDLSSYLCRSLYIICGYYMIDMSTDDQDYSSKCVLRSTFKTCVVLNCNLRFIDFPSSAYLSNIHMTTDLQLVVKHFLLIHNCHKVSPSCKSTKLLLFSFLGFFFFFEIIGGFSNRLINISPFFRENMIRLEVFVRVMFNFGIYLYVVQFHEIFIYLFCSKFFFRETTEPSCVSGLSMAQKSF